jgi:hypothetical protein
MDEPAMKLQALNRSGEIVLAQQRETEVHVALQQSSGARTSLWRSESDSLWGNS